VIIIAAIRDNIYIVKTLKEFQYLDEDQKDQGANVRQKAKDITNLLQDDTRLRQERKSRAYMHDRLANGTGGADDHGRNSEDDRFSRSQSVPPGGNSKRPPRDDEDMRRAIEESKRSLQAEQDKQNRLTKE
jgi:epsin